MAIYGRLSPVLPRISETVVISVPEKMRKSAQELLECLKQVIGVGAGASSSDFCLKVISRIVPRPELTKEQRATAIRNRSQPPHSSAYKLQQRLDADAALADMHWLMPARQFVCVTACDVNVFERHQSLTFQRQSHASRIWYLLLSVCLFVLFCFCLPSVVVVWVVWWLCACID